MEVFIPFLDCRESDGQQGYVGDSDLPLFWGELRAEVKRMSAEDLKSDWFKEFLLNHPAVKLPLPRHHFVCDTHLALQDRYLNQAIRELLNMKPEIIIDGAKSRQDWRTSVRNSSIKLLTDIYEHDEDGRKRKSTSDGQPFPSNLWGLFSYDRNVKQHAGRHVHVWSIAELEVFTSSKLLKYLPIFLKGMLKLMEAEQKKANKGASTEGGLLEGS